MIKVRKGGYTVLDLSNVALTASGSDYIGTAPVKAFTAIKDGDKPVMVSGLKISSTKYRDSLATYTVNSLTKVTVNYLLVGGKYISIEVSNDGSVKATVHV